VQDYYQILGVSRNATTEEIKEAYKRLARLYHPDVNPSKDAEERFKRINEAYAVLKDPVKRKEYDNLLDLQSSISKTKEVRETPGYPQPPTPRIVCEICGAQDQSLRVSVFLYIVSILIATFRIPKVHILCRRCRLQAGILANLVTLIFGWWGFPWGPLYSLYALFINLFGGEKPTYNNDLLLQALAYDFARQQRYKEARDCIQESINLGGYTKEKQEFLNYLNSLIALYGSSTPQYRRPKPKSVFSNPWLVLVLGTILALIVIYYDGNFFHKRAPFKVSSSSSIQNTPKDRGIAKSQGLTEKQSSNKPTIPPSEASKSNPVIPSTTEWENVPIIPPTPERDSVKEKLDKFVSILQRERDNLQAAIDKLKREYPALANAASSFHTHLSNLREDYASGQPEYILEEDLSHLPVDINNFVDSLQKVEGGYQLATVAFKGILNNYTQNFPFTSSEARETVEKNIEALQKEKNTLQGASRAIMQLNNRILASLTNLNVYELPQLIQKLEALDSLFALILEALVQDLPQLQNCSNDLQNRLNTYYDYSKQSK